MKRAVAVLVASLALGGVVGATTQAADGGFRRIIYVRNLDPKISNRVLVNDLAAFQTAVSTDFAPKWGTDAKFVFIGKKPAPPGAWSIELGSGADALCMCLGYHDRTDKGVPIAYVFDSPDWTVTFTHEVFEMLADPYANRAVEADGTIYWLETADPVEGDKFAYTRAGADGKPVTISDFVFESWFIPGAPGPYDFTHHVTRPLQILAEGYMGIWQDGAWVTIP